MAPILRPGRLAVALGVTLVTLVGLLAVPAQVGAATAEEAKLMALTNSTRAAAGAPALVLDGTLSNISRQWAQVMANNDGISHNANARNQIEAAGFDWRGLAENVGMGPTVESVHIALVNSPGHYTNMVNPSYTRVGIGIVTSGGYVWVVQNFVNVAGPAAPAPAPAPRPTAAPASPPAPPPTVAPAPVATTPPTTAAPRRTTTTEAPTTTTTTTVPLPPPAGLPLLLAQLVQQVKTIGNQR